MSLKAILAGAEHKLTICLSPPSALKLHITDYYAQTGTWKYASVYTVLMVAYVQWKKRKKEVITEVKTIVQSLCDKISNQNRLGSTNQPTVQVVVNIVP